MTLGSKYFLLGFLSVTGDYYNSFLDILATVYAYPADWSLGDSDRLTVRILSLIDNFNILLKYWQWLIHVLKTGLGLRLLL